MELKNKDRVRIKPQRHKFYKTCIGLNTYTGTLESSLGLVFADVVFDNNEMETVYSEDLELIMKNQQLLFEFME